MRFINGEWTNVSAMCKRQNNLGFFIENCSDEQNSKLLCGMKLGDDADNDEDYSMRYPNNHRPDLFWVGDGFREQLRPKRREDRMSVRRPTAYHYYNDCNQDKNQWESSQTSSMFLNNRYPAISSITLIDKNLLDGAKRRNQLPTMMMPPPPPPPVQTLSSNYPKHIAYHPYRRPIISPSAIGVTTVTPGASRIRMNEKQSTRITVTKCCCCQKTSVAPMLTESANSKLIQMPWLDPKEHATNETKSDRDSNSAVTNEQPNPMENTKQIDEPE